MHKMTKQAELVLLLLLLLLLLTSHFKRFITFWYKTKISNEITSHIVRNTFHQITQEQNLKLS